MKVFLDTDVLVSALATRGLGADLFTLVIGEHELVIGEQVMAELRKVLRQKFRVPAKRVDEVESYIRDQARVGVGAAEPTIKVRDATDGKVLAGAIAGGADILVTGDRDLLDVAGKAPFPIVTPRGFWERLRGDRPKDGRRARTISRPRRCR